MEKCAIVYARHMEIRIFFFRPLRIPHQILDLARLQLSRVPLIRGVRSPYRDRWQPLGDEIIP